MTFETALESLLSDCLTSTVPANLAESIRYSLLAPGKRIRPRLLLACSKMLGLAPEVSLPAAAALEMIHCFTLIHDDLPCMDNDDMRRGQPTNHRKFGEANALLAGDALMAMAFETLLRTPLPADRVLGGLRHLIQATGCVGVIGGQAAESLLTAQSDLSTLQRVHAQKTGALFLAAVLIPKHFAELSKDSLEGQTLIEFGQVLGEGFQVADDLEDHTTQPPHTSILAYQSAEVATQSITSKLVPLLEKLKTQWGTHASSVVEIGSEVIAKLNSANTQTGRPE